MPNLETASPLPCPLLALKSPSPLSRDEKEEQHSNQAPVVAQREAIIIFPENLNQKRISYLSGTMLKGLQQLQALLPGSPSPGQNEEVG